MNWKDLFYKFFVCMKIPYPPTGKRKIFRKTYNSYYIFFNDYSVPRIANNFGVSEDVVRVVHHPSDLSEVYNLTPEVYSLR